MFKALITIVIFSFTCLAQIGIINNYATLYKEPNIASGSLANLVNGNEIRIIKASDTWVQAEFNAVIGYVKKNYLKQFDYSSVPSFTIEKSDYIKPDIDGFRNAKWGMSVKEVRKLETLPEDDFLNDNLFYSGKIANLPATIIYEFIDGKLVSGTYAIKDIHITNDLYLNDYNDLKKLLTEKYNKPNIDKEEWLNETFKGEKLYLNMAIGMGHVTYKSLWLLNSTKIFLVLSGSQGKAELLILYNSEKFSNIIEKQLDKTLKEGL